MDFDVLTPTFDINFVPDELHTSSELFSNMPQNYEPGKFPSEELLIYTSKAGIFAEMDQLTRGFQFLLLVISFEWEKLHELLYNKDDKISEFVGKCFKLGDFLCVDFDVPAYVLIDIYDSKNSKILTPKHMNEMNTLIREQQSLWIENERIWLEEQKQMNQLIEARILEYPRMSEYQRINHRIPPNWSKETQSLYFRVWKQKERELDLVHRS